MLVTLGAWRFNAFVEYKTGHFIKHFARNTVKLRWWKEIYEKQGYKTAENKKKQINRTEQIITVQPRGQSEGLTG